MCVFAPQNNLQILKDLSNLQIQRRMLEGFTETRRKILVLKSNNKHNWLAFAIGNHLQGDYSKALSILDALQNTAGMGERAPNDKRPPTYEESEMHLYRAQILEESGKNAECVAYLEENGREIIDKMFLIEKRCSLLLLANTPESLEAAQKGYRTLLEWNPENYAYHVGFQKALGFIPVTSKATKSFQGVSYTPEQAAKLLEVYTKDPVFIPKDKYTKVASAVKRIPLHFTSGATFKTLVESYLRDKISRGIPSLFSDLEPLYADPAKALAIQEAIEEMLGHLRKDNKFCSGDAKDSESPSSLMYALHFAAQHYDHCSQWNTQTNTRAHRHNSASSSSSSPPSFLQPTLCSLNETSPRWNVSL